MEMLGGVFVHRYRAVRRRAGFGPPDCDSPPRPVATPATRAHAGPVPTSELKLIGSQSSSIQGALRPRIQGRFLPDAHAIAPEPVVTATTRQRPPDVPAIIAPHDCARANAPAATSSQPRHAPWTESRLNRAIVPSHCPNKSRKMKTRKLILKPGVRRMIGVVLAIPILVANHREKPSAANLDAGRKRPPKFDGLLPSGVAFHLEKRQCSTEHRHSKSEPPQPVLHQMLSEISQTANRILEAGYRLQASDYRKEHFSLRCGISCRPGRANSLWPLDINSPIEDNNPRTPNAMPASRSCSLKFVACSLSLPCPHSA